MGRVSLLSRTPDSWPGLVSKHLRAPEKSERGHPLSGTKEMWLAPFDSLQIH